MPRVRLPFLSASTPARAEHFSRLTRQGWASSEGRHAGTCLVARSMCRYRSFDLSALPPGERRAALRNLLLAWSPFPQTAWAFVWKDDQACAWAWDAAGAEAQRASSAHKQKGPVLPETLWQEPGLEGLRIIEGLEGFEMQRWRQGRLDGARWTSGAPTVDDWTDFLRVQGLADQSMPAAQPVRWLSRPWAEAQGLEHLTGAWSRSEQWVTGLALIALVGFSGAQGRVAFEAWQSREAAQEALDAQQEAATPIALARKKALAQSETIQQLSQQLSAPQPLEVLLHLNRQLPAQGVTLKDFELSGNRLRLGLELKPDVSHSALIKQLQAGGWFTQVTEQKEVAGRPWTQFDMQLKSPQMPVVELAPVASAPAPAGFGGGKP